MRTKTAASNIQIDCSFPGGNIVVERIEGDDVWLHQDLRDTTGHWFYWHFRVRGAAGRTLTFHFTNGIAIGVRGPAVSTDGATTWRWLGAGAEQSFRHNFPPTAQETRFCFGIPYQFSNWRAFAARHAANPAFIQAELCRDRKGTPVPYARFGCVKGRPVHRVAITCRHHCCEMMADYVLEGLMDFVLADPGAEAGRIRSKIEFLAVPFVDLDGVESGDQGKNRAPRDHGRDYLGESIYPVCRAIRQLLPGWSGDLPWSFIDLHCPWIRGAHNEVIYLVGSEDRQNAEREKIFSNALESVSRGPLKFAASDFLPFGAAWNTGGNYSTGQSPVRWTLALPRIHLATAIEIPYANVYGTEVTPDSCRAFGATLARAVLAYLEGAEHK